MNKIVVAALVTFAVANTVACSSADRSTDADSTLSAFKNPTGSFTKETGASAFSGATTKQSQSGKVNAKTGSNGGSSTQSKSIRILADKTQAACQEGEACKCEGGGTATYKKQSTKLGLQVDFTFADCFDAEGGGFSGEAMLLASEKPLLGLGSESGAKEPSSGKAPAGSANGSDDMGTNAIKPKGGLTEAQNDQPQGKEINAQALLLAARGEVISGKQRENVEFAILSEAGYTLVAVEVKDGSVVVGFAPNGTAIVRSKEGSWTCRPQSNGYQCKADGSGEALEVASSEGSSKSSASNDSASRGAADSSDSEDASDW